MSSKATLMFEYPSNEAHRLNVFSILEGFGAEIDHDSLSVNGIVEAQLVDCSDPIDDLNEVIVALDSAGVSYFASTEAFKDVARGDRYEAMMCFNVGDGRVSANFPWAIGEPDLDERSMRIAGFGDSDIDKVVSKFIDVSPAPSI